MKTYGGTKALDAEIEIDFSTNNIFMDYSSVEGRSVYDSNTAIFLKNEWKEQPFLTRFLWTLWIEVLFIINPVFYLYRTLFTYFVNIGWITSKERQYDHQMLMRYYYSFCGSTYSETKFGPLTTTELVFALPTNMFVDYELDGECREKISSISLKRNFKEIYKFGKFKQIRQDGWNLILKFDSIPKNGYCKITSLY